MKAALIPHITEKSYRTISEDGKAASIYTFLLGQDLDKERVKKAVEKEYKVKVTDVHLLKRPGKDRRFKGISGRTSVVRKALVRLKAGDRIAAFDIQDTKSEHKE